MTWYKTGTASVTSGSNAVIGTGTSFIANSRVGDAFRGPDGEWYEVTNIASDTALSIAPNYQGATLAAGGYSLAPMQGYVKDSADALRAATQVIGQVGADLSAQVVTATSAAAQAAYSASVADTRAVNASASATSADASKVAAKTSEDNAKVSETNALASKNAAASSAVDAANSAASSANKAAKGANSDITSLSGLTTPLSIPQGGTGGSSQASAQSSLGLVPTTSRSDATAGRLMTPGAFGLGGRSITIQNFDFASTTFVPSGSYYTDTPVNGPAGVGSSYFRISQNDVSGYTLIELFSLDGTAEWTRVIQAGAVKPWVKNSATWGVISGNISDQTDLNTALAAKPMTPNSSTFVGFNSTASLNLPAGGTWAWWRYQANSSTGAIYSSCAGSVSAGGTSIWTASAGIVAFGFYWRIS